VLLIAFAAPHVDPANWARVEWKAVQWGTFLNVMFWNLNYWDSVSCLAGAPPLGVDLGGGVGGEGWRGGRAVGGRGARVRMEAASVSPPRTHTRSAVDPCAGAAALRPPDPPRAGEVDRPARTFPRALLWAVLLVVASYLLPTMAALGVMADPGDWELGYYGKVAQQVGRVCVFISF
jgi:hypothetical protein